MEETAESARLAHLKAFRRDTAVERDGQIDGGDSLGPQFRLPPDRPHARGVRGAPGWPVRITYDAVDSIINGGASVNVCSMIWNSSALRSGSILNAIGMIIDAMKSVHGR
jgi:hypothetical protein